MQFLPFLDGWRSPNFFAISPSIGGGGVKICPGERGDCAFFGGSRGGGWFAHERSVTHGRGCGYCG